MDESQDHSRHIRVLLSLVEDWHGLDAETIWCEQLGDGLARICNSPFYFKGLSYLDIIEIEPSGVVPQFKRVVERSGHSTYWVIMFDKTIGTDQFLSRWHHFEQHGCTYEGTGTGHFTIDVPPDAYLAAVYRILEAGEEEGIWDFAEGHCAGT